jgi:hypothetical protein
VFSERYSRAALLGSADGHDDGGFARADFVPQLGPREILEEERGALLGIRERREAKNQQRQKQKTRRPPHVVHSLAPSPNLEYKFVVICAKRTFRENALYAIWLIASHSCHSRQTEGLTGNPESQARAPAPGFPIGRFAAVGNDIDESISRAT